MNYQTREKSGLGMRKTMANSKLTSNMLSIIIPAYNESKTIHLILDKIKHVTLTNNIQKEIIIVN